MAVGGLEVGFSSDALVLMVGRRGRALMRAAALLIRTVGGPSCVKLAVCVTSRVMSIHLEWMDVLI